MRPGFVRVLAMALAMGVGGGVLMYRVRAPRTGSGLVHTDGHGRIDINSASLVELERLPGIGPAYARRIVEGRPYERKDELLKRNVIPLNAYEEAKEHMVASHR